MVRLIFSLAVLFLLASCNNKNKGGDANATSLEPVGKIYVPTYKVENFEGSYTGSFDKGLITVVINYVNGKNVSGYNLHKGLRRNINGSLTEENGKFSFELKEPGDNPFDGTFSFTIDTTNFTLAGWWTPFDSTKTSSKQLSLAKKAAASRDYSDQLGSWIPASGTYATDTILQFDPQGTCQYNFYEKPGDSTSQMITVKGNYAIQQDTVIIEWQRNDYTPDQKMKLVKLHKKVKADDYDYDELMLKGHGWKMTQFMGD